MRWGRGSPLPDRRWRAAGARRRAAALDRNPYFGDRATVLAFVRFGLDLARLSGPRTGCPLSDHGSAAGAERQRPDSGPAVGVPEEWSTLT
ncbi:hypothetical protein [Actinocatenispora rupis]|uniref:Uncharacterized protein n=1 Tax=Actinocatenispora rupis TaxID=519421 RepID=A0A8J3J4A1_9ACTN|nr:hypothetical protein [Actinocatenispora rupis]GID09849.1 hypothetical protein Aru02nite_07380 [Actinocatenispora rupis]